MLDYAFFWTDWSKCARIKGIPTLEEESRYVERPDWCDRWADYLNPISLAIQWFLDRVHPKIDYVKIDYWDTWSMDHTLSPIILPMLKQLKEKKHGSPFVDDEDVPDQLKSTNAPPKEDEYDVDGNHHARWDWVMSEMIFAFTCKTDDSWQDAFRSGKIDMTTVPVDAAGNEVPKGEHKYYQMKDGPNHTYQCDYEGMRVVEARIQNGFRLFGKYYQALWD
jgi:hypothetical protein